MRYDPSVSADFAEAYRPIAYGHLVGLHFELLVRARVWYFGAILYGAISNFLGNQLTYEEI